MTRPVALITGGAVRIGCAIVEGLLDHGWDIALHCWKSVEEANFLKKSRENQGGQIAIFQANLKEESSYTSLVQDVYAHYGRLDCLVHNASVFEYDDIHTSTREIWDEHFEINLRAPFVLSQKFSQIESTQTRNILFLIDQRVWNLTPYFMSYTLTKSSVWTLTRTLAMALAPSIRVNAIGPGPTLLSTHQSLEDWELQCARTLLKKSTHPHEIVQAILYILNAPSLTGQMIALDNGQHMGWSFPSTPFVYD